MDGMDQKWYQQSINGSDQDTAYDEERYILLQPADRRVDAALLSTYHNSCELSADVFAMPEWPPSIRAAAKNVRRQPTHHHITQDNTASLTAYPGNEGGQAAANAPFSFHNRSLQLALPQMQYELEVASEDSFNRLSSFQRADSAMGSLDDLLDFGDSRDAMNFRFDGRSAEQHDDFSYHPGPLQYHLIRTENAVKNKKSVIDLLHSHSFAELNTQSPSSENRPLPCPLCANRQYTGVWAQRNLTRHMENVHAPSSSPDGVKHVRCSYQDCDRTFRREDARLVHERRSHPELNRPPPTKRKRSGDL